MPIGQPNVYHSRAETSTTCNGEGFWKCGEVRLEGLAQMSRIKFHMLIAMFWNRKILKSFSKFSFTFRNSLSYMSEKMKRETSPFLTEPSQKSIKGLRGAASVWPVAPRPRKLWSDLKTLNNNWTTKVDKWILATTTALQGYGTPCRTYVFGNVERHPITLTRFKYTWDHFCRSLRSSTNAATAWAKRFSGVETYLFLARSPNSANRHHSHMTWRS